jgi:GNAT superfamily N-acetyltransferase
MTAQAWVFQRGVLWAMDFARVAPVSISPQVMARFAEVQRDSTAPLARAMDLRESEVVHRLETGRRCFVGWLGDEIVTYGWLSQRDERVGELERVYRVQPGNGYIWHCATLPTYRGQGLYNALLSHITLTLRDEGAQRAWIGANRENRPSLRAFAHVGFQPIVAVVYLRLLNLCCLGFFPAPAAPHELVSAAQQMLTAPHERAWRAVAIGFRPAAPA